VVNFTPRPLYPRGKSPGTHWIGGWVDLRAGLDDVENRKFLTPPGLELRPLRRLILSQSLYRLSYPGSLCHFANIHMYILHDVAPSCLGALLLVHLQLVNLQ
jgi:hypothetical protein